MKNVLLWLILSFSFFTQANNQDVLQKTFKAVFNGKIELISTYLTAGLVDVRAVDNHGNTLLHTAVAVEDPLIVRFLLEYKADPLKKNKFGATPLSLSKELENTQITNMLTQIAELNWGLRTEQNSDSKNNPSQTKEKLPSMQDLLEEKKLEEALWQAVTKGTAKEVSGLLSIGADKYIDKIRKQSHWEKATTLLLTAIRRRELANRKKAEVLVTSEGREFEQQEDESKVLQEIREADKIIDILVKKADVNLQAEAGDHLTLPLNLAISYNLPDVVEKLIQAGASVLPPKNTPIFGPLQQAMNSGFFEIIEILLKHKAPFPKELNDYFKKKGPYYRKILLFVYQYTRNPDNVQTSSEKQSLPNHTEDKTQPVEQELSNITKDKTQPVEQERSNTTEDKTPPVEQELSNTTKDKTPPVEQELSNTTKDKTPPVEQTRSTSHEPNFINKCRRLFRPHRL